MIPLDLTRAHWDARPPGGRYVAIRFADRPGVELHHTVGVYGETTPQGLARALQRDHLGRGWTDVFYNLLVWPSGVVVELRPVSFRSGAVAHLTVALPGDYDTRPMTVEQQQAVQRLRAGLADLGGGSGLAWHGQRDPSNACPGRNVVAWARTAGDPAPPAPAPDPQPEEDDAMPIDVIDLGGEVWLIAHPYRIPTRPEDRDYYRNLARSGNNPQYRGPYTWDRERLERHPVARPA